MDLTQILKLIIATAVLFTIGYAVYMKMNGIFG
jgi:hypothetical protein